MSSELPVIGLEQTPYGSVLKRSLEIVQLLDLPGITKENRHLRWMPWDDNLTCPYVTLSVSPEVISPNAGTNERDDIGYGFMLTTVWANNGNVQPDDMGIALYWRWQTMRAFLNRKRDIVLPPVCNELRTVVRPGAPMIDAALRSNRGAQYWYIQTDIREIRATT